MGLIMISVRIPVSLLPGSIPQFSIPNLAGRIRKGPAPLNLEVPAYEFNDAEGKLVIG